MKIVFIIGTDHEVRHQLSVSSIAPSIKVNHVDKPKYKDITI